MEDEIKCPKCVPSFNEIKERLLGRNLRGYPVNDIFNLSTHEIYQGQIFNWSYRNNFFYMLDVESIIGVTYSGEKRFDPYNIKKQWYKIHLAKIFKDRILTCGSIKPDNPPFGDIPFIDILVSYGSSLAFLHDNQQLCYVNTTYLPIDEISSASVGLILGRLSKPKEMSIEETEKILKILRGLPIKNEAKLGVTKRTLRFPICRPAYSSSSYLDCLLKKMDVYTLYIGNELSMDDRHTGLYAIFLLRTRYTAPFLINIVESIDKNREARLSTLFLLSHALFQSYAIHRNSLLTIDTVENILKELISLFKDRLEADGLTNRNITEIISKLEDMNIIIRKDNKMYWVKGSQLQSFTKYSNIKELVVNTKIMSNKLQSQNTSRDILLQGIENGCYIII